MITYPEYGPISCLDNIGLNIQEECHCEANELDEAPPAGKSHHDSVVHILASSHPLGDQWRIGTNSHLELVNDSLQIKVGR